MVREYVILFQVDSIYIQINYKEFVYVVVNLYLRYFFFFFFFFFFNFVSMYYHTRKQKKNKNYLRQKINYNIFNDDIKRKRHQLF